MTYLEVDKAPFFDENKNLIGVIGTARDITEQKRIANELNEAKICAELAAKNAQDAKIKAEQQPNHVLRYIGELSGDLQNDKGNLEVKLVSVPSDTALGGLKGSDSFFEIYTESYGDRPIVIQGAGAGSAVTARGVFGDILRLSDKG